MDDSNAQGDRYEVEVVLQKKGKKPHVQYLVKWAGWPDEYNEWVTSKDIDESLIKDFEKKSSS